MLSDRICQQLTAYIDGELNPHDRQVVERLLRRSPEARVLLEKFHGDSKILRNLPRRRLHRDFPDQVLRTIADRRLHRARRFSLGQRSLLPLWGGLAVAAAVLLMVTVASWLILEHSNMQGLSQPPVANQIKPAPQDPKSPAATSPPIAVEHDPKEPPVAPHPKDSTSPKVDVRPESSEPPVEPKQPPVKPKTEHPLFTNEVKPDLPIVDIKPPTVLSVPIRDLDQEKNQKDLRELLQQSNGYHAELFSLDPAKALDRLRAEFKAHGIQLVIDPEVKARSFKTDYAFYAEDMTSEELAKVLEQVGSDDKKAAAPHRGDGQFGRLIVFALTQDDYQKLSRLLGVAAKELQDPGSKPRFGLDIHKPISQDTTEQITKVLEGQGGPRQPAKLSKAPGRTVLVLPYDQLRPQLVPSLEVKQFLNSHADHKPGTIQVLLVMRKLTG